MVYLNKQIWIEEEGRGRMNKKVLVLEDEDDIRGFILINLKRGGYQVIEAKTGEEALQIIDQEEGLYVAILDIMLPGISGLEVCQYLRKKDEAVGIIMLTAKTQEVDKITGLYTGADDYMTKPFSPGELVARVDVLHRRVELLKGKKDDIIFSGPFSFNRQSRTLLKNEQEIELTQIEYKLMECFFDHPGIALCRDEILNKAWGDNFYGDGKVVDVNIRRLRKKIEEDPSDPKYILTEWGYGYRWGISP